MATVADLIRDSLEMLGVLAAEEAPSAADQQMAFRRLNAMLDSWATERLSLFATLRSTYTLTPSLNPHTLGTGGTFNATRPVRIDRASRSTAGTPGTEVPLDLLSDAEWQNTQGKTSVGTPLALWVEDAYPLMRLWFNPVPNAADTLVLYSWQQLGRFGATTDTFDLPPGYELAIGSNLAIQLAPAYGTTVSQELADIARESKATLKRLNAQPGYLRTDAALLVRGGRFNLISGDS